MAKPKIYKAELRLLNDKEVKQITKGIPIEERIEPCPECGGNEWWLYPQECAIVNEGMKPYCECLGCGYTSHL
jgi:DNA-directed RNA polymerase subunit M/transcription elongation factor TFIIS